MKFVKHMNNYQLIFITLMMSYGTLNGINLDIVSCGQDWNLLDKNQKKELERAVNHINKVTNPYELHNRRNSLSSSLKEHALNYKDKQKAYKNLFIRLIDDRLKEISPENFSETMES